MENMDIIAIARELGKKLQQEEAYIKYNMARQAADEDKELQQLIAKFSELRTKIAEDAANQEEQKDIEGAKKRAEENYEKNHSYNPEGFRGRGSRNCRLYARMQRQLRNLRRLRMIRE